MRQIQGIFLLWTAILLYPTGLEAQVQYELTVQLLPGGHLQQLEDTLELLAKVAEEETFVADRDTTLPEIVRERCGTATRELLALFREQNPGLPSDHVEEGTSVEIPACPRWFFDKRVRVQPNTTAWDIAIRYLGSGGERALGQLQEANRGVDIENIVSGQELRIPYVSLPVSFSLKTEFNERHQEILEEFKARTQNGVGGLRVLDVHVDEPLQPIQFIPRDESLAPAPTLDSEPGAPPDFSSSDHEIGGLRMMFRRSVDAFAWRGFGGGAAEEQAAAEDLEADEAEEAGEARSLIAYNSREPMQPATAHPCAGTLPPTWPFDAERLVETLRENRRRAHLELQPAVVAVVDTGIERAEAGVYDLEDRHDFRPPTEPRFSFAFSHQELEGWRFEDDDDNLYDDDIIGTNLVTAKDFPEAEADPAYQLGDHGIGVAGLVLGGFQSSELNRLSRERIRLKILNVLDKVTRVRPGHLDTQWRIDRAALSNGLLYAGEVARIANFSLTEGARLQRSFGNNFNSTPNLLLVTAAGNARSDLDDHPVFPMALGGSGSDRAITVAAHDPAGKLLGKSNTGKRTVDLAAPGCAIQSSTFEGGLKLYDGTSFAAPIVSFTAALLSAEGIENPRSIKKRIVSTVDADPTLENDIASAGRLNVVKAVSVYDDLVVLRGRQRLLKGKIVEPPTVNLCGEDRTIRKLKQLVLDYSPADGRGVRITHFGPAGNYWFEYCNDRPQGRIKIEDRDGRVESLAFDEIAEIVPAEFRGR